eukprot:6209235-Pleurochrysis_carterae.AAC.1
MYKWGHPVATLPSDGRDHTLLSQNDVNSANHLTRDRSRRDRSLQLVERLCSRERERDIKVSRLATPKVPSKKLKPHNKSSPAPTISAGATTCSLLEREAII